jgi:hypothetical protein
VSLIGSADVAAANGVYLSSRLDRAFQFKGQCIPSVWMPFDRAIKGLRAEAPFGAFISQRYRNVWAEGGRLCLAVHAAVRLVARIFPGVEDQGP